MTYRDYEALQIIRSDRKRRNLLTVLRGAAITLTISAWLLIAGLAAYAAYLSRYNTPPQRVAAILAAILIPLILVPLILFCGAARARK
jgi:uncharacterized membrane protein YbhN (UPF0104 family)